MSSSYASHTKILIRPEPLDNLNLIHMNGRVYDPGLGRFISADPFIDGWAGTQGYNRYS
jgi:RHS repeat-associated protein